LITGGEPTVRLAPPEKRGKGGRNQQLVLAALDYLQTHGGFKGLVILSGGTDGEDGPTDAAGAWIDAASATKSQELGLSPADSLSRKRRLPLLPTPRHATRHRPHAHQRLRLARGGGSIRWTRREILRVFLVRSRSLTGSLRQLTRAR